MASPFPGMDPYLESPDIWPDFHHRFATEISSALNRAMPSAYYARLEMRPEVGIVEEAGHTRRIIPDVAVVRHSGTPPGNSGTAVLESPRVDLSQFFEFTTLDDPIQHPFVEIRDASQGHKLITLIEIVSPSNKRRGPDQESYRQKQREVLASDANLIEIDLLRSGERLFAEFGMHEFIARIQPSPDYLVLVNRAWRRNEGGRGYQIFPVTLRELLPCFPVPLRKDEVEVPLDLQFVFNQAYDAGPYRRGAIDYSLSPNPPLAEADRPWASALLKTS